MVRVDSDRSFVRHHAFVLIQLIKLSDQEEASLEQCNLFVEVLYGADELVDLAAQVDGQEVVEDGAVGQRQRADRAHGIGVVFRQLVCDAAQLRDPRKCWRAGVYDRRVEVVGSLLEHPQADAQEAVEARAQVRRRHIVLGADVRRALEQSRIILE